MAINFCKREWFEFETAQRFRPDRTGRSNDGEKASKRIKTTGCCGPGTCKRSCSPHKGSPDAPTSNPGVIRRPLRNSLLDFKPIKLAVLVGREFVQTARVTAVLRSVGTVPEGLAF